MTGWTETSETEKKGEKKRPKDGGGGSEPRGEFQRRCYVVCRERESCIRQRWESRQTELKGEKKMLYKEWYMFSKTFEHFW